jgi:hypothetical protein
LILAVLPSLAACEPTTQDTDARTARRVGTNDLEACSDGGRYSDSRQCHADASDTLLRGDVHDGVERGAALGAQTLRGTSTLQSSADSLPAGTDFTGPTPDMEDLAISCIALGRSTPDAEELGPERFEAAVRALALFLQANLRGEFAAFLEARRGDIAATDTSRAPDLAALHALLRNDLGHGESPLPPQWTASLQMFWRTVYATPPMLRVAPPSSNLCFGRLVDPDSLPAWERSRPTLQHLLRPRSVVEHRPVIAHRRSAADILARDGELHWMDWTVTADLRGECNEVTVFQRFVWDAADGAWFLHDATTSYPDSCDPARERSFLLL